MKKIARFLFSDINFLAFVLVSLFLCYFLLTDAHAEGRIRTVFLNEQKVEKILIRPGKLTALSFPIRPDNSVLGIKDAFSISYVEADLIITPRTPQSHTNLFVYMYGRRFAFDLLTTPGPFDEIVQVRDATTLEQKGKKNGR